MNVMIVLVARAAERGGGGGNWGILPWAPKRLIYFNRTVKYSIKAVTTYILPWAPKALSAALLVASDDVEVYPTFGIVGRILIVRI